MGFVYYPFRLCLGLVFVFGYWFVKFSDLLLLDLSAGPPSCLVCVSWFPDS